MWTVTFWKAIAERVLATALETALGILISVSTLGEINWRVVGSTVALASLVALLKNVLSALMTNGSPSLSSAEVLASPAVPQHAADPEPVAPSVTANADGTITVDPGTAAPGK